MCASERVSGRDGGTDRAGANLLFVLTGSIACYKACDAISQLVQRGHRVRAVATAAALRFVGVATLEALTRDKVGTDLFAPGEALDHINLVRWADATIVCPATANTLNAMAAGLADDLAGSLLLAHEWHKPLLLAPAMNPAMWSHPATRASIERLRAWGARFISVGAGRTACGEVGEGRLAEPDEIVAEVEAVLARPARRLRVLVTSGGTTEPIDAVRVITNSSTGATGAMVASHFARCGHDVTLVRARQSHRPAVPCRERTFVTFADLNALLEQELAADDFDVVIHAAAVSDFSVHAIEIDGELHAPGAAKLRSDVAPTLRLRRNPKILDTLRQRSRNADIAVVAFKLTHGASAEEAQAAVHAVFEGGVADFVVHNDLLERTEAGTFPAVIWARGGRQVAACRDRSDIAPALLGVLIARSEGLLLSRSKLQPGA